MGQIGGGGGGGGGEEATKDSDSKDSKGRCGLRFYHISERRVINHSPDDDEDNI